MIITSYRENFIPVTIISLLIHIDQEMMMLNCNHLHTKGKTKQEE